MVSSGIQAERVRGPWCGLQRQAPAEADSAALADHALG